MPVPAVPDKEKRSVMFANEPINASHLCSENRMDSHPSMDDLDDSLSLLPPSRQVQTAAPGVALHPVRTQLREVMGNNGDCMWSAAIYLGTHCIRSPAKQPAHGSAETLGNSSVATPLLRQPEHQQHTARLDPLVTLRMSDFPAAPHACLNYILII